MGTGSGGITSLKGGNTLGDNIIELKKRFPVTNNGYFGTKGMGRGRTRNIESVNPARTAAAFASIAGRNPVSTVQIEGKGIIYRMRDGSIVTHRYFSSSADSSPVVELKVKNLPGIKSQKIHFVKKGR